MTPQAFEDLEAICLFIARDSPQMAGVFADRALRATDRLADYPRSGTVVPELGIQTIRELIVGSYRIIYRLREDQVHLLTVHHAARMLDVGKM
ncbi:MAG TPA: type II toxin-antitoxin system RelE/ParE family toxin [Candidatus Binatia bacterium]